MVRSLRQGRREFKSEINIVPLLDILLVLVLIFMTTGTIATQSIEVDLPDRVESQAVGTNDNSPIIIEVSNSNLWQYSIVVEKDRMEQLLPEQVIAEVRKRLNTNPKTVFLISGDKDVSYDKIIKALNLLHGAGVKSVGLMTQPI